jgi:hypothetical protein
LKKITIFKVNKPSADFLKILFTLDWLTTSKGNIFFFFPLADMIIKNVENLHIFQNVKMSRFHDLFALTQDRKLVMLNMAMISSYLISFVTNGYDKFLSN